MKTIYMLPFLICLLACTPLPMKESVYRTGFTETMEVNRIDHNTVAYLKAIAITEWTGRTQQTFDHKSKFFRFLMPETIYNRLASAQPDRVKPCNDALYTCLGIYDGVPVYTMSRTSGGEKYRQTVYLTEWWFDDKSFEDLDELVYQIERNALITVKAVQTLRE